MSGGDVDTLDDIDEALTHARAVPVEDRGDAWYAWVDGLLERRRKMTGPLWAQRETAVVTTPETR